MSPEDSALEKFRELAAGSKLVYMATRVYDLSEKQASYELETAVIDGLTDAAISLGVEQTAFPTFMPFRDTIETITFPGAEIPKADRARSIYEDDVERLSRLFALITYLNDPSKDDGICFEIGYAFVKSVPIILVVTDFINYSSVAKPFLQFELDPILLRMCGKLIHFGSFPKESSAVGQEVFSTYQSMISHREEFAQWLMDSKYALLEIVRAEVRQMADKPTSFTAPLIVAKRPTGVHPNKPLIFIDFAGGMFEYGREYANRLEHRLTESGMLVTVGRRHDPGFQEQLDHESSLSETLAYELGEIDINNALASDVLILDGDGMEVSSGTAALLGAARATGKKIILYYSGNLQTNARDRAPTIRNLMLQYAADITTSYLEKIPDEVDRLLRN
jgi:nucleoside 2-deoxyribosyltransferase